MPYPDAAVPHAATGPLAGLSFGVKDLFDVAGYPTSGEPSLSATPETRVSSAAAVRSSNVAISRQAGHLA